MPSPVQGPLVSAVAFVAMETHEIAAALKAHGFSIVELGARTITGARSIPGHPATTTREANFARIYGSVAWTGALLLRYPHPRAGQLCGSHLNAPGARFPALTARVLHQIRWVRTLDELEAWLGGAVSIPLDDAERAAIAAGEC